MQLLPLCDDERRLHWKLLAWNRNMGGKQIAETDSGAEGSQTEDMVQTLAGSVAATFTTSVGWAHPTTGLMAFQPKLANFTVSANPASLSVVQGRRGTSTITTAISGGFNNAISLSASGIPTGTTVSFNPC